MDEACDGVMRRMEYAPGLIRYSTQNALAGKPQEGPVWRHVLRPRVLVYAAILAAVAIAAGVSLWLRTPLKVDVIRDRAAIAREVEGGLIENVYRLQIMNTTEQARAFEIAIQGLPGIHVWGGNTAGVPAATSRLVPVRVRVDPGQAPGSYPVEFTVTALGVQGVAVTEKATFVVR